MSFQYRFKKVTSVFIYAFWNNIITSTFEILIANILIFVEFYQVLTIEYLCLSVQ